MTKTNNTGKKIAAGALLAAAAGYVAGILTAPKSGKQTRKDIADKAGAAATDAEAAIKKLQADIDLQLKNVKQRTSTLSTKAKAELDDAAKNAKIAKKKSTEIVDAFRRGSASNPELNKAVKQLRDARNNLTKYLKS